MPKTSPLRIGLALVWVVLAVLYVVRSTVVAAYAENDLEGAERVWPDHPAVQSARAMLDVAVAASQGRSVESSTLARIQDVARSEPLAPEPFLIAGAAAQRSGDMRKAETLLLAARQRDPRAPAARFLLAGQYISQGRIREGVPEAAVLGRLVPGSGRPLSQAFARYIETAGVPKAMGEILRSNPTLSDNILSELAGNAANADLLLKIAAMAPERTSRLAPSWQSRLINKLVQTGDYTRARQVWAKLGGRTADPSETIHDPRFEGSGAPRPFNWTITSEGAVIEPQSGGLHVLYFGRDDVTLAGQLLVLRPGRYRLRMKVTGQVANPGALRWNIACLPGKSAILDRPLGTGDLDFAFDVPSRGCGAQQLALTGRADESARSSDFIISNLSLTAAGAR
jgi:hypothetical protein